MHTVEYSERGHQPLRAARRLGRQRHGAVAGAHHKGPPGVQLAQGRQRLGGHGAQLRRQLCDSRRGSGGGRRAF